MTADHLFPVIIYLIVHSNCDTLSRRFHVLAEAVEFWQENGHPPHTFCPQISGYSLEEVGRYCTMFKAGIQYLYLVQCNRVVACKASVLLPCLQHAVRTGQVTVEPPCLALATEHVNIFTVMKGCSSLSQRENGEWVAQFELKDHDNVSVMAATSCRHCHSTPSTGTLVSKSRSTLEAWATSISSLID